MRNVDLRDLFTFVDMLNLIWISQQECLEVRVDTKFRDTKFREISHQEFISYFAKFLIYFAK
jgi:hypothetical protein